MIAELATEQPGRERIGDRLHAWNGRKRLIDGAAVVLAGLSSAMALIPSPRASPMIVVTTTIGLGA
jgi:hypothetical protein